MSLVAFCCLLFVANKMFILWDDFRLWLGRLKEFSYREFLSVLICLVLLVWAVASWS